MADLRIVDAPVLLQESITDDVKMPTGGLGNFSIRLGDLVWYVVAKEQLASKNYVDLSSKGVKDSLDEHIADKANPHQVTKTQVGLGNVDNTADIDKPVSDATKSAIITATTDMATKTYVNQKDNLKADKATTLSGYGITDAYTKDETRSKIEIDNALTLKADVAYVNSKDGDLTTLKTADKTNLVKAVNEIHDVTKGVVALYDKNVEAAAAGAGANGWTDTLIALSNGRTQREKNAEQMSIKDFGAIGDGTLHKVSEWTVAGVRKYYKDLAAIQVDYPHVTSLDDSIDWAATQKAINSLPNQTGDIRSPRAAVNGGKAFVPKGNYRLNRKLALVRGTQLVGESREASQFVFSTDNGGIEYLDSGREFPDEITIRDLAIYQDQSITPTSGAGISCMDGATTVDAVALNVQNVLLNGFYYNLLLSASITSSIRNVNATNSQHHGIYVKFGTGYTLSTSILFDSVYSSLSKNGSGFRLEGGAYCFFNNTASDSNARYGYELYQTNTCGINGGAEANYLGGVYSYQCRSPRIFVNIVARADNLTCDAVTLDQTGGAVIGGVHSSRADQTGMSIRSVASGAHGTVELGLIRTGGWNNTTQKSNAAHSITLGGVLNGFCNINRQWAFGTGAILPNIQLQNSGNADSTVEHGFATDVAVGKANASSNSAFVSQFATQNTAVTYAVGTAIYAKAPNKGAASTINRYYGTMIDESSVGATANANLMIGGLFVPPGNWNIYSPSTRANYLGGALTIKPTASATPSNNGDMTFELTNDTTLKIKVKGSDGVVRSASLTLA